jgi:hypothetical protein
MTANPARSRHARPTRRLLIAAAVAALGMFAAAPAALAAPTNDAVNAPFNVELNGGPVTIDGGTIGATWETGELLTPGGNGECSGRKMVATTWYRILGNGGTVSVNTAGSNFDTVLSIYAAPTPTLTDGLPCNDDVASGNVTSAVSFPSVAGRAYLIQAGGCSGTGCGAFEGNIVLNVTATEPPGPGIITLPPPPPPPDADADGVPENGADKCPNSKPTRDENKDGCQDKPKRILSDLSYDFRYLRRGSAVRGIRLSVVKLTRAPKGSRVSVTCSGCRKPGLRRYSFTTTRSGASPMGPLNGVQLLRGSRLTVVVTRAEHLGRRIVVTMGPRRDVVKLSCLAERSRTRRVPCSSGS